MDSGKTVNYWPGFVDALANVVVTMVFVIVVFTVALLYLSQTRLKEALAAAQAIAASNAAAPTMAGRVAELERQLAAAVQDNQSLRAQLQTRPTPLQGRAPRADVVADQAPAIKPPAPAAARVEGLQSLVRVVFPAGAVELDAPSLQRLEQAFGRMAEQAKAQGVTMVALPELGAYSEGKRLSYYRNLALRNWLIDRGVRVDQIRMRIAEVGTDSPQAVVQITIGL